MIRIWFKVNPSKGQIRAQAVIWSARVLITWNNMKKPCQINKTNQLSIKQLRKRPTKPNVDRTISFLFFFFPFKEAQKSCTWRSSQSKAKEITLHRITKTDLKKNVQPLMRNSLDVPLHLSETSRITTNL